MGNATILLGSAALAAQQPVPPQPAPQPAPPRLPADSAKGQIATTRDSTKGALAAPHDSTRAEIAAARRKRLAADTLKAPLARAELPVETGGRWHWSGEALRAAGAVTLADLLARLPGATSLRANWIPAPQFIAWNGDVGRVRVFLDGVELDAIDARSGSVLDLSTVPIWQLEEVSVERGPGELRVHLRSWRVQKTTPFTRTDITQGSENTNLYRGYFGKRMHNGGALQVAAQQYSTTSLRRAGDGSSLQVMGRIGWAWKQLSVDGSWNRAGIDRAPTIRYPLASALTDKKAVPAFKGSMGSAYARLAWGDPDAATAPWVQLIAATQGVSDGSDTVRKWIDTVVIKRPQRPDTTNTIPRAQTFATSRAQYIVAAGASRWGVRGSVTARLRVLPGRTSLSPSARLGYDWRFVSLAAYAETRGADSTRRLDVTARVAPWRWLVLSGAHGSYTPNSAEAGGPAFTASRLELSSTLFGVTLSGGMLARGVTTLAAPVALDRSLVRVPDGAVKGAIVATRGAIYRDLGFDISAVLWDSRGAYRPQMDVHGSLILDSSFPGKFTRNNFHLLASTTFDHRTPMFFPTDSGGIGLTAGTIDVIGARVEIRIESGTVFYQSDNMVGKVFETAPGYMMPRRLQFMGLRWDFWN